MATLKKDSRTKKQQQSDFLVQLELTGNITMACQNSKVPRRTIYNWLKSDLGFKEKHEDSVVIAIDMLEDEAYRRAYHGVGKPVYQGGKKVGTVIEQSDTLLIFLLKCRRPDVYKDRQEVKSTLNANINLSDRPIVFE